MAAATRCPRRSTLSRQRSPVAGIVLASGLSRRFGRENKLLLPVEGVPLVVRTATAYLDAGLHPIMAVVGHEGERVRAALDGLTLTVLQNPDFAQGQSRALVTGVSAIPPEVGAAVIGVADQPFITASLIRAMVTQYRSTEALIVAPRFAGRRGNPVLFDRRLFRELLSVTGDQGGRPVLQAHASDISWIDRGDQREGMDIDTLEEFRNLTGT